ncbi:helix-turn-helix domain-containing protein [Nonomuraea sp. CA-143628]|uniref:helix-turn-helix domain-containing protein n=1 Tax=Nonomuraea sp. CA-143628 TaxID=3239997 RepID=UPI003D8FF45E
MTDAEPRTQRDYLGMELRRLRELAGLSGEAIGAAIGVSQVSASRIERGVKVPTAAEVGAWADAVNADAETRERLLQLAEAAHTEVVTWRAALRGQLHMQGEIAQSESTARTIRNYQPLIVPGLLQTADYARRVFEMSDTGGTRDHAAALGKRIQRQEILYDTTRRFEFLITEAALRLRVGGVNTLLAQVDRIISLAALDNISVGILPIDRQVTFLGWNPFVIYDDVEEGRPFVRVEMTHGVTTIERPEDVALYVSTMNSLRRDAFCDDEARELLGLIVHTIRDAG